MCRSLHKGLGTAWLSDICFLPATRRASGKRQKVSTNSSGRGSIKAFPASSITRRHQANYEKDFSELTLGWPPTTTPCQDGQDGRDRQQTAIIVVAVMSVTTRRAMRKSDDDSEGIWPLGNTWVHPGVVLVCNRELELELAGSCCCWLHYRDKHAA